MSSFGSQIRKRLAQLHMAEQDVPRIMMEVARSATIEAVKASTNNTPPNGSAIAGTNTRSGQLAQHWGTDSIVEPVRIGNQVETWLKNNMQYASYVNDGHRMDKHFVPGLIKNGAMLERVSPDIGGITVGTRTSYVRGKYIKEKGIGKYRSFAKRELDRRIREALR